MRNGFYPNQYGMPLTREELYAAQERQVITLIAIVFVTLMLIMRIDRMYTNIQNPLGLPGGLSQFVFYSFGLGFFFAVREKKDFAIPLGKLPAILWVVGLSLASFFAVQRRIAITQPIAFFLYFVAGYGVYKASLDDKIFRHFAKLSFLIGLGWSIVIMYVFFKNGGKLPYEYIAFLGEKGTFNHHAYGLLIINGGIAFLALASKKRGTFWNIVTPIAIIGTFFAIAVSQSRANFLAFTATCTYVLLQNENIKGRGALIIKTFWIVATIVVVFLAMREGAERYEGVAKRFDFSDEEYQLQKSHGRPQMIKKALILISTHPFGVGGGNARFTKVEKAELMRIEGFMLHNHYLSSIAEGGWLLIISWFIILNNTIIKPFKFKWRKPERLAVYSCWMNFAITGLMADQIGDYFFLLLFMVSSAIALEMKDAGK